MSAENFIQSAKHIAAADILFFYHFSEEIKLDISCESSADSHVISSLIFFSDN